MIIMIRSRPQRIVQDIFNHLNIKRMSEKLIEKKY